MADEAFALSPINARASLPTDSDYDAIHEAFMETSRGRWFLGEYAKRNRNADTRMVLDVVERIEATLASQKQAQAEVEMQAQVAAQTELQVAEPQIDLWPELIKAFTRTRIEIAQRLVHESNEQAFEAIRASVETIKSVSWALRERGFDARICDILDVQVNAITDGYTSLLAESSVASEVEAEVLVAFDALIQQVEALTKGGDAETEALDAVVDAVADAMGEDEVSEVGASFDEDDVASVMAPDTAMASDDAPPPAAALSEPPPAEIPEAAPVETSSDADAAFREIYGDDGDIEIVDTASAGEPPAAAVPTEPEINKQRLYEAKLEPYRPSADAMPAPAKGAISADDIEIVDVANVAAERTPPNPAPMERPHVAAMAAAPSPEQPTDKPASLGQALIANGVIPHPASNRPDPLAPFRRMSQAEKVAFFS